MAKNMFKSHPKLSWIALSLLVVGGIVAALELTNTTYWFHDQPQSYTASEYTKGESSTDENTGQPTQDEQNDKGSSGTSKALVEPTGNFVSSHHATAVSNEASTCNSTPGATCKITFTKDGVTKSLPAKTLDNGGATYWEWQPGEIGLTSGSWKVKAVTSLGDQTKAATDALTLEIK